MIEPIEVDIQTKPKSGAIDMDTQTKLRKLMKRDRLDWRQFLKRAVDAYDLLYSPAE